MTPLSPPLGELAFKRRILDLTDAGTNFCSEGQSVKSATDSMVLKVVTDNGRLVCDSVLLAPSASPTRACVDAAAAFEQGAEGRAVRQERLERHIPVLLLVG